jgi:hypothetical protein
MVDRDTRVNVRISKEEAFMLKALAESEGVSISDSIRLQMRKAYAEKFGDKDPRSLVIKVRKR